ncbi:MAG TPA: hypothetical protein VFQ44_10795 [Streptosporangiaceae bacterium]|nr:hypothetical protein [Streptosporangiaceae bacterium]
MPGNPDRRVDDTRARVLTAFDDDGHVDGTLLDPRGSERKLEISTGFVGWSLRAVLVPLLAD